jgi:uncharacterized protein YegL
MGLPGVRGIRLRTVKMTDPNRTHITAVLDRSGSMAHLTSDTIGGFNGFLKDQRALPGSASLTLILFNTEYTVVHDAMDLKNVPDITKRVYSANGGTALYDALAKAIQTTGAALSKLSEDQRPGAVIVLVMTDGQENSSQEFPREAGRQAVQAMVKHQTEAYSWNFVFMGANIDAKAVGESLGVHLSCSVDYVASAQGTSEAYKLMSQGTQCLRERSARGEKGGEFFKDPNALVGAPSKPVKPTKGSRSRTS